MAFSWTGVQGVEGRLPEQLSVADLRAKLGSDPTWVSEAIVMLWHQQTTEERDGRATIHLNKVGFSLVDSHFLSCLAEQLARGETLTPSQLAVAYCLLPKYSKQLSELSAR